MFLTVHTSNFHQLTTHLCCWTLVHRVKDGSEEDLALVCFLFVLLHGMNHFSSSENSVTERINRLCHGVHLDLQYCVPQKPARLHGMKLEGPSRIWLAMRELRAFCYILF